MSHDTWTCQRPLPFAEAKEREFGVRCDNLSGMCRPDDGEEDDAPTALPLPLVSPSSAAKRIYLHKALLVPKRQYIAEEVGGVHVWESACMHVFHAECLVVSVRSDDPGLWTFGRVHSHASGITEVWVSRLRLHALVVTHRPRSCCMNRGAVSKSPIRPPSEELTGNGKREEHKKEVREVGEQWNGRV